MERHVTAEGEHKAEPAQGPVRQSSMQIELLSHSGPNGNGAGYSSVRKCPDCNAPVIFQEGCLMCVACGWNKCE